MRLIDGLYSQRREERERTPREEEEEQEEQREAEQDEDEYQGDDEEPGAGAASRQGRKILRAIQPTFTYFPQIRSFALAQDRKFTGGAITKSYEYLIATILAYWARLKGTIKKIADLLGFRGILIVLDRAMQRNVVFWAVIKTIFTFAFMVLFVFIVVLLPLYRFYANPARILRLFTKELEVDLPTDPE